ncbi:MAG: hypothetical protein NT059_05455, partial [Planctomycetota bacterium]|nr:hypothetical protein [Planctomycetota bacterium]
GCRSCQALCASCALFLRCGFVRLAPTGASAVPGDLPEVGLLDASDAAVEEWVAQAREPDE